MKAIKKAIKKPVPVEVWQIDESGWSGTKEIPNWVDELIILGYLGLYSDYLLDENKVELGTLGGVMTGHLDDYLVHGNHDDVWIVQKEIFEDTYDIVDEDTETSNLVKYAESELGIAYRGIKDEYSEQLQKDTLDVIKLISAQGHSGQSLATLVDDVTRLLQYKPLTPIQEDEGWPDKPNEDGVLQNARYSALFKEKDGSYSDVENWGGNITFPYYPK